MNIAGYITIRVPPQQLLQSLEDPQMLAAVLPACRGIRTTAPGRHVARLEHKALPVGVDVDLTVTPSGSGMLIEMQAGGMVTGRVRAGLQLDLTPVPAGSRLDWYGDLSAKGLAGRLVAGKDDAVQARVLAMFRQMKQKIEAEATPGSGAA